MTIKGITRALAISGLLALALAAPASAARVAIANQGQTISIIDTAKGNAIVQTISKIPFQAAGEQIIGLDVRPADGQLYVLTYILETAPQTGRVRLYTVDPASLKATFIANRSFVGVLYATGFDFNPVADRIRGLFSYVINGVDTRQSIRFVPTTFATTGADTAPFYAAGTKGGTSSPNPVLSGAAYTNSTNPAPSSTTLYVIDSLYDRLDLLGGVDGVPSPNGGQLTTVGFLGFDTTHNVGFDIAPNSTTGLAALQPSGGTSGLYLVQLPTSLTSGAPVVSRIGDLPLNDVGSLAILPGPPASK